MSAPPDSITTTFRCRLVNPGVDKDEVVLTAVDGDVADQPHGELRLHIHNDDLRGLIEAGEEYELDIRPAD
jgi:hypothetical protein